MMTGFPQRRLLIGTILFLGFVVVPPSLFAGKPERLKVEASGRFLVREDGTPFFWLGDTAWELFHRLKGEEVDRYLEDRAAKGFTVIQAVVLAELDGLRVPNAYGDVPLIDLDPMKPNEAYFKHVDYVVRKANSLGLYIGMLPTWGDKVTKAWGLGPEVFTAQNARPYGEFLGRRYKDDEIVWILGGDRSPVGDEETWAAMAHGLRAGDEGAHVITGHWSDPKIGRGSSPFFHNEAWLSFNLAYSGHRWAAPNYKDVTRDYKLQPRKPVIDGEPRYENHPYIGDGSGYYRNKGRWDQVTRGDAHQMRQAAYWAMLAGAAGHTYGCHDVWQMYDEHRESKNHANTYWHQAIDFPGAAQMGMMRRLFESRRWQTLVPDQTVVVQGQGEGENHVQAARAKDNTFLFAYLPMGHPVTIRMDAISGDGVVAQWFDPRTEKWARIDSYQNTGTRQFTPPTSGPTCDWVLVLDRSPR